jgi:hypothetical protein
MAWFLNVEIDEITSSDHSYIEIKACQTSIYLLINNPAKTIGESLGENHQAPSRP